MSRIVDYNQFRDTNNTGFLCHAPNLSMHISQNGVVSACSLTRFTPLGNYPRQSLNEIWWGEKAREMRNSIKGSQFPDGCDVCRADFNSGNFANIRARHYDKYAGNRLDRFKNKTQNFLKYKHFGEFPKVISFELSNTCNLECLSCIGLLSSSIRKNREKMPPIPQLFGKEFLEELIPFLPFLEEAKFYGGEPFLIQLYIDIWEYLADNNPGCCIYITTNGTVFNKRIENILRKLKNVELIVSLDGISKSTLEKIRVNANYETVMSNLFKFKEILESHGKRLTISPTYMRYNWHEYPALYDFANKEQILFQTNLLLTPKHLSISHMNLDEITEVYETWKSHCSFEGPDEEINKYNKQFFNDALNQIAIWMKGRTELEKNDTFKILLNLELTTETDHYFFNSLIENLGSIKDPALMLESGKLVKMGNLKAYFNSFRKFAETLTLFSDSNFEAWQKFELSLEDDSLSESERRELVRKLFHPQVLSHLLFNVSVYPSSSDIFSYLKSVDISNFEIEAFDAYYGY
jgi:MoaA/NifB/PqqE/SkfB family radical SAM enzyme